MEKRAVLVVEDDFDIRENICALLEFEGYPVLSATDGEDALNLLRVSRIRPHLIILDLMMPVMDGRAFLQARKNDPEIAKIPVLVLTASMETIDEDVVAVLRKPIDIEAILKVTEQYAVAPPLGLTHR